ncbi:MAG TPA: tetratricopeptide repeat protein [Candidatus Limnocylindrales bacterium]|nr:tetratricopeptide repeat protein [Candidatus Limnocylindrales bacterium]
MPRTGMLTAAALTAAVFLAGCAGTSKSARPGRPDGQAAIPALLAQGDSAAARGAPAEARAAYARAAEAAKRSGEKGLELRAELGAGLASLSLSDAEAARRSLTRAVELDPGNASAHVALGRYHAAVRRYRDAKAEFDRAAALDTLSAEPYYRLGLTYAESGDAKLAADSFTRALARDPNHAPSQAALSTVLDSHYLTAGLPAGYGALRTHPSISRGELGVMLAAELGQDPERPSWRGSKEFRSDTEEARGAWGERWIRAAMARGWIAPFPDRSYHLGDPVTRGALALLIADIEGGAAVVPSVPDRFPDIGPRHYLLRAARTAVMTGLPLREEGRFEPWASVTGAEALAALQGVARTIGVEPVVREEPGQGGMVK